MALCKMPRPFLSPTCSKVRTSDPDSSWPKCTFLTPHPTPMGMDFGGFGRTGWTRDLALVACAASLEVSRATAARHRPPREVGRPAHQRCVVPGAFREVSEEIPDVIGRFERGGPIPTRTRAN